MEQQYNLRSPAVKRIMREARELREPTHQYHAQPLEDNLFEWHFTVAGATDSAFDGGRFHGRIILPSEYPMKPPHIIVLTPNGRFVIGHKICLSVSGHHPETWQPSWSIRTVLLALIGFMPTKGEGAIGALDYPDKERTHLAKQSVNYVCPTCGVRAGDALPAKPKGAPSKADEADEALAAQISFKGAAKSNNASTADGAAKSAGAADTTDGSGEARGDGAAAAVGGTVQDANNVSKRSSGEAQESGTGTRQRKSKPARATVRNVQPLPPGHRATDWIWTIVLWTLLLALVALFVRRVFFL